MSVCCLLFVVCDLEFLAVCFVGFHEQPPTNFFSNVLVNPKKLAHAMELNAQSTASSLAGLLGPSVPCLATGVPNTELEASKLLPFTVVYVL